MFSNFIFYNLQIFLDNIWKSEIDFIVNRNDRLVILSFINSSPYQNDTIKNARDRENHEFDDEIIESLDYDLDPFETHESMQSQVNTPSPTENIVAPTIFDSAPIQFSSTFTENFDYFIPDLMSTAQSSSSVGTIPSSTIKSTLPTTTTTMRTSSTIKSTTPQISTTKLPTTIVQTALPTHPSTPSTSSSALPTLTTSDATSTEKLSHHSHHQKKPHNKSRKHKQKHRQYLPPPSEFEDYDPSLELKNEKELDFDSLDRDIHMVDTTRRKKIKSKSSSEKLIERPKSTQSEIHNIFSSSAPTATDSKIFEIKAKSTNKRKRSITDESISSEDNVLLYNDMPSINEDSFIIKEEKEKERNIFPQALIGMVPNFTHSTELEGIGGFLQSVLGNQDKFDPKVWFQRSPTLEYLNLALALLVWSVRYPSVFWDTSKAFSLIFSLQMIINSVDILLLYVGTSILFKREINGQFMTVHHQPSPLLLNGIVTLALTLLAYVLIIASSMILYLYGHSRLSAKIRDCQMITLKDGDLWSYFSHCASLCFILGISVVKAPIIHDLSIVYRISLDKTVFVASKDFFDTRIGNFTL